MTETALILASLAIIFSGITAIFSFLAYSTVVGLKNSTHQVQYVPLEEGNPTEKELDKKMYEAFGYEDEAEDYIGLGAQ